MLSLKNVLKIKAKEWNWKLKGGEFPREPFIAYHDLEVLQFWTH